MHYSTKQRLKPERRNTDRGKVWLGFLTSEGLGESQFRRLEKKLSTLPILCIWCIFGQNLCFLDRRLARGEGIHTTAEIGGIKIQILGGIFTQVAGEWTDYQNPSSHLYSYQKRGEGGGGRAFCSSQNIGGILKIPLHALHPIFASFLNPVRQSPHMTILCIFYILYTIRWYVRTDICSSIIAE
jgi:hypothetical protein